MSLAQKKAKYSKADWAEAYAMLAQVGLKGRIQRLVLLATMVLGRETFSIKHLQGVITHFSGEDLTTEQVSRSLNPLFKKGYLQYTMVEETYDPSVFSSSKSGELLQRRYYYPRNVTSLTDEVKERQARLSSQ